MVRRRGGGCFSPTFFRRLFLQERSRSFQILCIFLIYFELLENIIVNGILFELYYFLGIKVRHKNEDYYDIYEHYDEEYGDDDDDGSGSGDMSNFELENNLIVPKFISESKNLFINEGDNFSLPCYVDDLSRFNFILKI